MSTKTVNQTKIEKPVLNFDVKRIFGSYVTGLIGTINNGKTMLLAGLIQQINEQHPKTPIYTFGIKPEITDQLNVQCFYTLEEMEYFKNALVFVDESATLFDPKNRKASHLEAIDLVFRFLAHNNVRVMACGVERDFNREFSGRMGVFGFKSLSKSLMINGSPAKMKAMEYKGTGAGYSRLDIPLDQALFMDTRGTWFESIPYQERFDTKKVNRIDLFG